MRVVCQGRGGWKSIDLLRESISKARKHGYRLRPSQPKLYLSRRDANELLWQNLSLARKCKYSEIQPAVTASGNNDRVIVLPGTYTEPTSRAQPLNDPRCADMTQTDSGGAKTPSYRYQVTCPNDQNLVHVAGRAVPPLPPPSPPLTNRQGIPDLGRLRALQPPARGHRRGAHRRDHRRRIRLRVGPSRGAPAHAAQARDHPRRPRRRLRGRTT